MNCATVNNFGTLKDFLEKAHSDNKILLYSNTSGDELDYLFSGNVCDVPWVYLQCVITEPIGVGAIPNSEYKEPAFYVYINDSTSYFIDYNYREDL